MDTHTTCTYTYIHTAHGKEGKDIKIPLIKLKGGGVVREGSS